MPAATPEELLQSFIAAVNAGDLPGVLELWTHDAMIVGADGQAVAGREQIKPALEALIENDTKLDVRVGGVYVAGDVAIVSGVLGMNGSGEQPYRAESRSTVVYRRGADGWRIALDAPWGLPGP
jgi:uncharacterized protein (TIGR02246 family)